MNWISVEERLPEGGRVVVARAVSEDGEIEFTTFRHPEAAARWSAEDWWPYCPHIKMAGDEFLTKRFVAGLRVTHWMPLPEPPEE